MYRQPVMVIAALLVFGCSARSQRGIADERSNFSKFLPMKQDPGRDGLRAVRPYFKNANREQIVHAIEHACTGGREGSSVYDPRTQAGYYVNCNPKHRQLLNGYVPANGAKRPHSHS